MFKWVSSLQRQKDLLEFQVLISQEIKLLELKESGFRQRSKEAELKKYIPNRCTTVEIFKKQQEESAKLNRQWAHNIVMQIEILNNIIEKIKSL